jgi:murein DD-endopeptidase MepM/ murein hydrolase activator NlpD
VVAVGGGEYKQPPQVQCISDAERADITSNISKNRKALIEQGILPGSNSQKKTTATKFDWPLQQASGFNYFEVNSITNYVDHDSTFPGNLQDWNCGTRTYDLATGNNHTGVDMCIYPFDINMMDRNQVQVVAAAQGIIIDKRDGNFDKNCVINTTSYPNYLVIEHADGLKSWYVHLKKNSLTSKSVGSSVAAGEVLGYVGSSGSSSGPHLHFEIQDALNNVLDPFSGPCNTNPSLWNSQKPYYESTINALMTHDKPPVFNACPMPHSIHAKDTFGIGLETIYFAAYYHDQMAGQTTAFTLYMPDGTVSNVWTNSQPQAWSQLSYWYYPFTFIESDPWGKWTFEADYQGKKVSHNFYRLPPANVTTRKTGYEVQVYPNPVSDVFFIKSKLAVSDIRLYNAVGQVVYSSANIGNEGIPVKNLAEGLYILCATIDGKKIREKIKVSK